MNEHGGRPFSDPATWPPLADCDLLIGRDPLTARRVDEAQLAGEFALVSRTNGLLTSLRALEFDVASGNAEASGAATRLGLTPVIGLELRDLLGSEAALAEHAGSGQGPLIVRFAPGRQDSLPSYPTFAALVEQITAVNHLILCEGDVRVVGPALRGTGAQVIFVDLHFYQLGDFVALARREDGFHGSTRLLNGPDSLTLLRDRIGAERLVFGSRPGFHESRSAIERLVTAGLGSSDLESVAHANLERLIA